eukprot:m.351693 g.351693  ORF g.351693 m.351693 type:complete len:61 (+) comp16312_c0_seq1:205-387(+)
MKQLSDAQMGGTGVIGISSDGSDGCSTRETVVKCVPSEQHATPVHNQVVRSPLACLYCMR